jgi:hypothetical protein
MFEVTRALMIDMKDINEFLEGKLDRKVTYGEVDDFLDYLEADILEWVKQNFKAWKYMKKAEKEQKEEMKKGIREVSKEKRHICPYCKYTLLSTEGASETEGFVCKITCPHCANTYFYKEKICRSCKYVKTFCYADSPSGKTDGVQCMNAKMVEIAYPNIHDQIEAKDFYSVNGYLLLWRIEALGKWLSCDGWEARVWDYCFNCGNDLDVAMIENIDWFHVSNCGELFPLCRECHEKAEKGELGNGR